MAMRIAKRREPDPVLVEILGRKALDSGVSFREAGEKLYLVESVALEFLILPPLREDQPPAGQKKQKPVEKSGPASPGSFIVQVEHLQPAAGRKANKKGAKKDKAGWKTEARKERRKRDV